MSWHCKRLYHSNWGINFEIEVFNLLRCRGVWGLEFEYAVDRIPILITALKIVIGAEPFNSICIATRVIGSELHSYKDGRGGALRRGGPADRDNVQPI